MPDHLDEAQRIKDLEALRAAFTTFNETTRQLQESYEKLQERIKALDLELEKKNIELEKNLEEKERVKNYLHNILESLSNGVIVVDAAGVITTFNKAAGMITGRDPQTCLQNPLETALGNEWRQALRPQNGDTGEAGRTEDHDLNLPDGRRIKLRVSASPVTNNAGDRSGSVLILQDITRFKALEEEAQRNDRLRAMGEMAAGIAHEIRNPLGSVELFASMLRKELDPEGTLRPLSEHIIHGVRNMDRIISSLLLFAKSPEPSRQQCDLADLLRSLLGAPTLLQVPDNIRVTCEFDADPAWVSGDSELLTQAFLNLMRNALQAMPEGGELHLKLHRRDVPNPDALHRHSIAAEISDTGTGISAHHRQQIFNPFFSTKDRGTGLGLSIVHNIVRAHQGTIDVESETGCGTTFHINLPGWDHTA